MELLMQLGAEHGFLLVFAVVLVEQIGVPIPAYPALLLTAALASRTGHSTLALLAAAVAASLVSDSVWYLAGRRHGRRVLGLLCRISLTPDLCVTRTELIFTRWGAPSLLVAKFVPGFATVATALAGTMGVSPRAFIAFDSVGIVLWAGLAITLGAFFSDGIDGIIKIVASLGSWAVIAGLVALVVFVLQKWGRRWILFRKVQAHRITVTDLLATLGSATPVLIVDARTSIGTALGTIPSAIKYRTDLATDTLRLHPRNSLLVVYGSCRNDPSALQVAKVLVSDGFVDVRPLVGGVEAWLGAGGKLEDPIQMRGELLAGDGA